MGSCDSWDSFKTRFWWMWNAVLKVFWRPCSAADWAGLASGLWSTRWTASNPASRSCLWRAGRLASSRPSWLSPAPKVSSCHLSCGVLTQPTEAVSNLHCQASGRSTLVSPPPWSAPSRPTELCFWLTRRAGSSWCSSSMADAQEEEQDLLFLVVKLPHSFWLILTNAFHSVNF